MLLRVALAADAFAVKAGSKNFVKRSLWCNLIAPCGVTVDGLPGLHAGERELVWRNAYNIA